MRGSRRVWITQWALTSGVIVTEAAPPFDFPDMIPFKGGYVHKPHWHERESDAFNRVENAMRRRIQGFDPVSL